MTPLQSTISEIDFKLRCIAHFKKVYYKCDKFPSTQKLMIVQTQRTDDEIWDLVMANKSINKKIGKLERKYDLKEWFAFCDKARETTNV